MESGKPPVCPECGGELDLNAGLDHGDWTIQAHCACGYEWDSGDSAADVAKRAADSARGREWG